MSALHVGCNVYVARIVDRAVELREYIVGSLLPSARLVIVHSGAVQAVPTWRTYSCDDVHLTQLEALRALARETSAAASEAQRIADMVDSLYARDKNR